MEQKKLTKADLRKVFLRSLTIMCSWNYERQMHMGFMCGMSPVLDKLYADDEERKKESITTLTEEIENMKEKIKKSYDSDRAFENIIRNGMYGDK